MTPSSKRVASRWLQADLQPIPRRTPKLIGAIGKRISYVAALAKQARGLLDRGSYALEDAEQWLRSGTNSALNLADLDQVGSLEEVGRVATSYEQRLTYITDLINAEERGAIALLYSTIDGIASFLSTDGQGGWAVRRGQAFAEAIRTNRSDMLDYWSSVQSTVPQEFRDLVFKLVDAIELMVNLIQDAEPKFRELVRRRSDPRTEEGERSAPPSSEIETLYHATVNARALLTRGFDKSGPSSVEGLGGAQDDRSGKPSVSFTSDLWVAKEIMRCLREVILIARGEVDLNQVFEWARLDGVETKVRRNADMERRKSDRPSDVFEVYAYYLAMSPKRYNPVFFTHGEAIVSKMRNKNPREVGILVCKVHMRHPDISYKPAMEEYRVPADAVVSIDRIIS